MLIGPLHWVDQWDNLNSSFISWWQWSWPISIPLHCCQAPSIITARTWSCGKLMFLRLSVILFTAYQHTMGWGVYTPYADTSRADHPSPRWALKWAVCILLECILFTISTYYHPPMKLWEGNVFPGVCLSTGRRVGISGTRSLVGGGYAWSKVTSMGDGSGRVGMSGGRYVQEGSGNV